MSLPSSVTAALRSPSLGAYQNSGKCKPIAWPLFAIALALSFVLGLIYAVGLNYIPVAKLSFIMTCVSGVGAGLVVGFFAYRGHVRSTPLILLVGVLAAVGVFYGAWVGWYFFLPFNEAELRHQMVLNPLALWQQARDVAPEGLWSLGKGKSANVSGSLLWSCWAIEAGILLLGAVGAAWIRSTDFGPYSETNGVWMSQKETSCRLTVPTQWSEMKADLETKNLEALTKLEPLHEQGAQAHYQVVLHSSPSDAGDAALSIQSIKVELEKGHLKEESPSDVFEPVLVSASAATAIRALLKAWNEAPMPAADVQVETVTA